MGELKSRASFFKRGNILRTHYFDQTTATPSLDSSLRDEALFSLVIDGGLHHNDQTAIRTWEEFYPYLMPGSIYVVEGCECKEFQRHLAEKYPDFLLKIEYTTEGPNSPMVLLHSTAAAFKSKIASSVSWMEYCKTLPHHDVAPFVDKHAIKAWVPQVIPYLKMAQEYAQVDRADAVTLEFLKMLPDN